MPQYKHPCPHCGNFIMRDVAVCPFCATPDPFTPGRCPQCSAPIEDPAWKACPRCGTSLVAGPADASGSAPRPAANPGIGWRAPSAPVEKIQQALGTAPGQPRPGALWGAPSGASGVTPPAGSPAPDPGPAAAPPQDAPSAPSAAPGLATTPAPVAGGSICAACGAPLAPGARFCTVCGTPAG